MSPATVLPRRRRSDDARGDGAGSRMRVTGVPSCPPRLDHIREDRERDLTSRLRADVDSAGVSTRSEQFLRNAAGAQLREHRAAPLRAGDQTDVRQARLETRHAADSSSSRPCAATISPDHQEPGPSGSWTTGQNDVEPQLRTEFGDRGHVSASRRRDEQPRPRPTSARGTPPRRRLTGMGCVQSPNRPPGRSRGPRRSVPRPDHPARVGHECAEYGLRRSDRLQGIEPHTVLGADRR